MCRNELARDDLRRPGSERRFGAARCDTARLVNLVRIDRVRSGLSHRGEKERVGLARHNGSDRIVALRLVTLARTGAELARLVATARRDVVRFGVSPWNEWARIGSVCRFDLV